MEIRHPYPAVAVRKDMFLTTIARDSCIELESNLPDLLQSTHRHLNSEHKLVTICEGENNHECSNV